MIDEVDKEYCMWHCAPLSGSVVICLNIESGVEVTKTTGVPERLKTVSCMKDPGSEDLEIQRNNPLVST